jgi:hypothetical protein
MIAATDEVVGTQSSRLLRSPQLILNRDVLDSLVIAAVLTGGSYLLAASLGWVTGVNPLEALRSSPFPHRLACGSVASTTRSAP